MKTDFDKVYFIANLLCQNSIKKHEHDLKDQLGYLQFRLFVIYANVIGLTTFL